MPHAKMPMGAPTACARLWCNESTAVDAHRKVRAVKLKTLLFVIALAVVATGCLRTEIDIEVSDDGSVDYSGVLAVDPDAIGQLDEIFGELDGGEGIPGRDQICDEFVTDQGFDEMPSADGLDTTIEPYDEDGFCGVRFAVSADAGAADEALGGIATGQDLILREEPGGGWYFELPLGEVTDAGDIAGFPGLDGFFDGASFVVRVKLPGTQVDHNADEIATDGTMIWNVDLLNPPGTALFVQTEPGDPITGGADPDAGGVGGSDDGSSLGLIVLLVVVALAAIAAAIWWFSRKKSTGSDAPVTEPVGVAAGSVAGAVSSSRRLGCVRTVWASIDRPRPDRTLHGSLARSGASTSTSTSTSTEQTSLPSSPHPHREQATGQSVWDPVRRSYVQWDPTAEHWLVFDDATQQWRTEA